MAERITLTIVKDRDLRRFDRVEVEIAGVVQPDAIYLWGPQRDAMGYGHGPEGQTGYGFGEGLPYGDGRYGAGHYGQGADAVEQLTRQKFVAEDYAIRLRAVDKVGNTGAWGPLRTIRHRPNPPAPTNLRVVNGVLTWDWSDP